MTVIRKDIPISTIEISKNGKKSTIWLNSIEGCVIRLTNVSIQNEFDKFDQIDINCKNGVGYAISNTNEDGSEDLRNFLLLLNQSILNEIDTNNIDYSLVNDIIEFIQKRNDNNE